MSETPTEIEIRLLALRERREQLQAKIAETRDLLARADARRAAEPENRAAWDKKLNNMEKAYSELKRDFERAKLDTERLERELAGLEIGADISLDSMIEDAAGGDAAEQERTDEPFAGRGLMRIISTPLDKLARLGADRISALESFALSSPELTTMEQKATIVRLEIAREMAGVDKDRQGRRTQFVLRAAIDKLQRSLMHEMTEDEAAALRQCHQKLSAKPARTSPEERLIKLIGGALEQLAREV